MNEIITVTSNLPENYEKLPLNLQINANEKMIFDIQKQLPPLSSYDSYYHYKLALLIVFKYLNLDFKETIKGQGTKDIPDYAGIQLIYNTIKETYPKLNANDIVFAFVLAMQNKITIKDEPIDLKLYGNKFNALYLTNILNAYTDYRREIIYKYNDLERNNQKLLAKTCEVTGIEKEQIMHEALIKFFNQYKEKKHRTVGISHYYDYLFQKCIITINKNSTEWIELMPKAIEKIKSDKINAQKVYELRSFIFELQKNKEISEVDIEIKNQILFLFFDSLILLNESIEKYLTN